MFDGWCFIITLQHEIDLTHTIDHNIHIRFNASISLKQMPQFEVQVNSKNNPNVLGKYHDGSPMVQTINHQYNAIFAINEERNECLLVNCRTEPILEYLASELIEKDVNCSELCIPNTLHWSKTFDNKFKDYPVCMDPKTIQCINEWARNVVRNAKSYCSKVSYTGAMLSKYIQENDSWCSEVATYAYLLRQRKSIDSFMC